jgi:hypothetical protein
MLDPKECSYQKIESIRSIFKLKLDLVLGGIPGIDEKRVFGLEFYCVL